MLVDDLCCSESAMNLEIWKSDVGGVGTLLSEIGVPH